MRVSGYMKKYLIESRDMMQRPNTLPKKAPKGMKATIDPMDNPIGLPNPYIFMSAT